MAYTGGDFDDCDPGEQELYSFDFSVAANSAVTSDTVVSAVWVIEVISGTDALASSRVLGVPIISGTKVTQMIDGLQPGVTYLLQALATMASGQVLSLYSHVSCTALS